MDIKTTLLTFASRRSTQVVSAGVTGLGVGVGATYLTINKRLEAKYLAIASKEIREARAHYFLLNKEKSPSEEVKDRGLITVSKVTSSYDEMHRLTAEYLGKPVEEVEEEREEEVEESPEEKLLVNIFGQQEEITQFDYEEELKLRNSVDPYVITHEEFFQNENENEQTTLTYFEGDEVLSDGTDEPVPDIENTIGTDSLDKFGYGSKDANVVYVHNPRIGLDMEVLRSSGKYAEEVLGFLEHSYDARPRKFRSHDE